MKPEEIAEKAIVQLGLGDSIWVLIAFLVIQALLWLILKTRLDKSVGLYFAKQLEDYKALLTQQTENYKTANALLIEDYKQEIAKRLKAEKVAELFAKFHYQFDAYEISRLIWELSFFLPRELVCAMSETLVHGKTPEDTMRLFIRVREQLGQDDGLAWNNIVYFAKIPRECSLQDATK